MRLQLIVNNWREKPAKRMRGFLSFSIFFNAFKILHSKYIQKSTYTFSYKKIHDYLFLTSLLMLYAFV